MDNSLLIPKVIHYCWFGEKPLPSMAIKCIESWKKYLPDYEIKQWDESNFDVNMIPYTQQAYEAKKYAFVSDYARFWILYNYGGLYFDTDVEIIKSLDDIIAKGPFMGCQNKYNAEKTAIDLGVAPGLGLGTYSGHPIYKELINLYHTLSFYNADKSINLKTIVQYTTDILVAHGMKNTPEVQSVYDIGIYPWDYFCPLSPTLLLELTENTRAIHHFAATWESRPVRFRKWIKRKLGFRIISNIQPFFTYVQHIIRR